MNRLITACLLPAVLAACGGPAATITYHQTGACNGGQGQSGDPSTSYNAGPNQAYVVFGIERIDNSGDPNTFNFDPAKMFVNQSPRAFVDPGLMIYKWVLGPFSSVATPVGPNVNIGFAVSGQNALVVQTTDSNGSREANQTPYSLLYNTGSGDPGVIMVKSDSSRTSWSNTEDCSTVSLK